MSLNKLSLKQFVKNDQKQKSNNFDTKNTCSAKDLINECNKDSKNNQSKTKKSLKLNTLPNEDIADQKQKFLFRSTWQGDIQNYKEQMKGMPSACQSPTFATEILSQNNCSNLFPSFEPKADKQKQFDEANRSQQKDRSNSRKNNKSLKKFIGDTSHQQHRQTLSTTSVIVKNTYEKQSQQGCTFEKQQETLYHISMLELQNQQLKRQNTKIIEKMQEFKQKVEMIKQENQSLKSKVLNQNSNGQDLMSNEQLFQRMQSQSFWKFYQKAQKLIRSSSLQNNNSTFNSPINFMKQLQALRQLSSQMRKQLKVLKKSLSEKQDQIQKQKDKVNITETQIEQMRLKFIAYQSSLKKLKEQNKKVKLEMEKLVGYKNLPTKVQELTKQLQKKQQSYSQLKILNEEYNNQRLNYKKRVKSLDDQVNSLNKQINLLKNHITQLQLQQQQLSANKKQLIQKQKLKQRNHQLQKQLKNIMMIKQSQSKQKQNYMVRYQKEIQIKDSQVKQLDNKVVKIKQHLMGLEKENKNYVDQIERVKGQNQKIRKEYLLMTNNYKDLEQLYKQSQQQQQSKLSQLSSKLQSLTIKLTEQQESITKQNELIIKLTKENKQKQQSLKLKDFQSQKLKQSLLNKKKQQIQKQQQYQNVREMEEYIRKLQQKHNEALQMYQNVFNEKVELEMEMDVMMQNQNCRKNNQTSNLVVDEMINNIKSILMVKQEIIKKILIFCPEQYKQLIVDYIYHGDMVEEKYMNLIFNQKDQSQKSCQNNSSDDDDDQQQSSVYDIQDDEEYQQNDRKTSTVRNQQYNKTRPYNKRNMRRESIMDQRNVQQEIYELMEKFMYIGKLIEGSKKSIKNGKKHRMSNQKINHQQHNKIMNKQNSFETQNMNRKSHSKGKVNIQRNFSNMYEQQNYKQPNQIISHIERNENYDAPGSALFKKAKQYKLSNQFNRAQEYQITPVGQRRETLRQKQDNYHLGIKNMNLMEMMQRMKEE